MKKALSVLICLFLIFVNLYVFAEDTQITEENYNELAPGAKGVEVTALQERLKELGYYTIAVDGDYGNGTKGAVYDFQTRNSLRATGTADLTTLKIIYSDSAIAAPAKPDIEIVSFKITSDYDIRIEMINNLDVDIDYFEYKFIPYNWDASIYGYNTIAESENNYDLFWAVWYNDTGIKSGQKHIEEGNYIYGEYDIYFGKYPIVAVGISAYHVKGGEMVYLNPEQISWKTTEGNLIYPIDESKNYDYISIADRDRSRTIKIGITSSILPHYLASHFMTRPGHYVHTVEFESPAYEAGLKEGDVIMTVNGESTLNIYAFERAKLVMLNGEQVPVTYWRNNKEYTTYFSLN